jgi:hypothetical protein
MPETERKPLPPYMPYKTFGTFLEHLRAIGMPSHIDKSVMHHLSGGMQSWLKAALRYMKLITADDEPTPRLESLVYADGDNRKAILLDMFNEMYGFATKKLDLKNTTPVKLRQVLGESGAQGETLEKIVAFMVAMGKDADVQMSQLITKRAPSVRRPRQKLQGRVSNQAINEEDEEDEQTTPDAAMKTVALPKAGGLLTLAGTFNMFDLSGKERDLVFAIIDLMKEFELGETEGEQ